VAHPCQPVIAVITRQHLGDQLGAPPIVHPPFDGGAQPRVVERELLGPLGLLRGAGMSHPGVIIAISIAVALYFSPDRDAVSSDLIANCGVTQTGVEAPHDRDAFIEAEPMAPAAKPIRIARLSQA